MMRGRGLVIALTFMFATSGCAHFIRGPMTGKRYWNSILTAEDPDWGYWEECRQAYVDKHPDLPQATKDAILQQKIHLGMSAEEVKYSWALFGVRAPRVNQTVGSWGTHEQWVLRTGYLYFQNGKLTSWQL